MKLTIELEDAAGNVVARNADGDLYLGSPNDDGDTVFENVSEYTVKVNSLGEKSLGGDTDADLEVFEY